VDGLAVWSRILGHEDSLEPTAETPLSSKAPGLPKNILKSRVFKDGAIYLFVRSDYKKPTWFCRVKVPNSKGYVWRSTRTTDEHMAFAFANDLYNQSLVRVLSGSPANAKRLGPAIETYLKVLIPLQDQASVRNRSLLMKRILPFLRSRSFDEVTTAFLSEITYELTGLSSKGRLSPNTVRRINSDLRHFLNWCVEEGHLTAIPTFPKIAGDQSRRTHFDDADWRRLARYLREFVKVENRAVRRDRTMLVNYVLILANTGIRVGEARSLKWRDIRSIDGEPEKVTGPHRVVQLDC
jgi:integrase